MSHSAERLFTSVSPADSGDVLGHFEAADATRVADAVARARHAFPAWRDTGIDERSGLLQRFRDDVAARAEELAQLIAREMGKAIWEARGEARLLAAKVDRTLADGMRQVEPIEVAPGARTRFHPRGVLAVLGPFNFPAHLPNGHIVPALATGNCVVFKPSEQTPATGAWLADAFARAGLPEGVLEVVQGDAQSGRLLAASADIDGVLFTGSWATGRTLARDALDASGKLLALEMGGKNALIVLEDADLELSVAEAALSICATTGQRCSSASRLLVHEHVIDEFSERLVRVLSGLRIGPPLEEGVFMGPLVSPAAAEKFTRYQALAAEAGAERVLEVDPHGPPPFVGPGLVRFATSEQNHPYQRDEIFGPEAALYPIGDLDHAIIAANDCDYGLVTSIMTRRRAQFEYAQARLRSGLMNWNKGTIGASGRLPFGGLGRSGNDRPAGAWATLYCTFPQAQLEGDGHFDAASLPPGMPRP